MKKIIFYDNNLTLRGTSVALYNYADYNEKILGNKSIIVAKPDDNINKAKDKFIKRFETHFMWFNEYDFEKFMIENNVDYFYVIKEGINDGLYLKNIPTLVHSVFCKNEPHGHKYAYVSDWLCKNQGYDINTHSVPHIVEKLPKTTNNLRSYYNIPNNSTVFGYYGGETEFNINWVKELITEIVQYSKDIYFIFMNINEFTKNKNVYFSEGTWDLTKKSMFVNTCDAMIHAREHGETFGLACGEFALENKPIITYENSTERSHIEILGERGIYYKNKEELQDIFLNFKNYIKYDDYYLPYQQFSPEKIMNKFNKVFLN